MNSFLD